LRHETSHTPVDDSWFDSSHFRHSERVWGWTRSDSSWTPTRTSWVAIRHRSTSSTSGATPQLQALNLAAGRAVPVPVLGGSGEERARPDSTPGWRRCAGSGRTGVDLQAAPLLAELEALAQSARNLAGRDP
jgi:hypothetical protein